MPTDDVSELMQKLKNGAISKLQLYKSLTDIYDVLEPNKQNEAIHEHGGSAAQSKTYATVQSQPADPSEREPSRSHNHSRLRTKSNHGITEDVTEEISQIIAEDPIGNFLKGWEGGSKTKGERAAYDDSLSRFDPSLFDDTGKGKEGDKAVGGLGQFSLDLESLNQELDQTAAHYSVAVFDVDQRARRPTKSASQRKGGVSTASGKANDTRQPDFISDNVTPIALKESHFRDIVSSPITPKEGAMSFDLDQPDLTLKFTQTAPSTRTDQLADKSNRPPLVQDAFDDQCTFQPHIKKYSIVHADKGRFLARQHIKQNKKEAWRKQQARTREEKELADCTFRPELNESSVMIASTKHANRSALNRRADQRKKQLVAQLKDKQEAQYKKDCTFKPELNPTSVDITKGRKENVQGGIPYSKTRKPTKEQFTGASECTFTPAILGVTPEMKAAQVYLEQDPFERLSYIANIHPSVHGSQNDAASCESQLSKEDQEQIWNDFCERQKIFEMKRQERLKKATKAAWSDVTDGPEISERSQSIITQRNVSNGNSADDHSFWERMHQPKYSKNGWQPGVESSEARKQKECTFKPIISDYSRHLEGRSVDELSGGDKARRDATRQMAQLIALKEQLKELPFKPELCPASAACGRSVLRVASDPDTFIARITEKQENKMKGLQVQVHQKEEEEVAQCTFTPLINESPAYVKDHVTSIVHRKPRHKPRSHQIPEWR